MKHFIKHYIYNGQHTGDISAVWFENVEEKEAFINQMKDSSSASFLDFNNDPKVDERSLVDLVQSSGNQVYVLSYCRSSKAILDKVFHLRNNNQVSIFLLNDQPSTTYLTDKIICVGKNGAITEELSCEPFLC